MLDAALKTQQPNDALQFASVSRPVRNRREERPESRELDLTMTAVAELSQADIRQMSGEELMAVIRTADIPLFRERMIRHLPFYDHYTLEQLAFLAQHTVRNLGY